MFRECAKGAAGHGVIVTDKCVGYIVGGVTLKKLPNIPVTFFFRIMDIQDMAVREGKAKVGKGILVTDLALLETCLLYTSRCV